MGRQLPSAPRAGQIQARTLLLDDPKLCHAAVLLPSFLPSFLACLLACFLSFFLSFGLEAIASRLEAIALRLDAIARLSVCLSVCLYPILTPQKHMFLGTEYVDSLTFRCADAAPEAPSRTGCTTQGPHRYHFESVSSSADSSEEKGGKVLKKQNGRR